ncbi:MAG: ImmA/IrrE family metallo-endopeptidase [Solirubrobacteraceae bacterium]
MTTEIKREAARDAARLLNEVWTQGIPVDPVSVARAAGLRVLEDGSLDQTIMGALVIQPNQDPTILLNENDGLNRRRFTCAHEIGHFIRRGKGSAEPATTIDFRNGTSSLGGDDEEIYANEFAACLLMPEEEVRLLRKDKLSELDLSIRFAVSVEAMHFRLKNLGLA